MRKVEKFKMDGFSTSSRPGEGEAWGGKEVGRRRTQGHSLAWMSEWLSSNKAQQVASVEDRFCMGTEAYRAIKGEGGEKWKALAKQGQVRFGSTASWSRITAARAYYQRFSHSSLSGNGPQTQDLIPYKAPENICSGNDTTSLATQINNASDKQRERLSRHASIFRHKQRRWCRH